MDSGFWVSKNKNHEQEKKRKNIAFDNNFKTEKLPALS